MLKKAITSLLLISGLAHATIVEFQTNQGNFRVNLFDEDTPATVANFLEYVNTGAYTNTIIHRSAPGFVIQGGGFEILEPQGDQLPIQLIETFPPVTNEPVFSNVRGTIAMAKNADPNSATSQWFFNLEDNSGATSSANLDTQNEGFTVFGQVIDDGMTVVDAVAALNVFNFGGTISQLPLNNYSSDDFSEGVTPQQDNFVIVQSIVVVDSAPDTAASLNPIENTLIDEVNTEEEYDTGSFGLGLLVLLIAFRRKRS